MNMLQKDNKTFMCNRHGHCSKELHYSSTWATTRQESVLLPTLQLM